MSEIDLSFVDEAIERVGRKPEAAIPLLQELQEHYRYLPQEAIRRVCELTEITPATIEGVSTFYDQFRHTPAGKHTIRVCIGTACHVKGADAVYDAFCRHLDIPEGMDTDEHRKFTVEKVACLGCCMLAPAVRIDDVIYGHLTPARTGEVVLDFLELIELRQDRKKDAAHEPVAKTCGEIRISLDTCCIARGSDLVYEAINRAVKQTRAPAIVKGVGCAGMSYMEPLVEVIDADGNATLYGGVLPADARNLVLRHFKPRGLLRRARSFISRTMEHLLTDEAWQPVTRYAVDVRDPPVAEFVGPQRRLATERCGRNRPLDLDEYLAHDGFAALRHCTRELTCEQVIERIVAGGLRGRGGAGYPTGSKWRQVRDAPGDRKYVVCNGDEGDPGAFMDRMLLESQPYRVIEGMAVAAYAVGAEEGVLYIRAEYPLAVHRVGEAIRRCEQRGLLGANAEKPLTLRIMQGAGAFVCGEETALLASIEGRRGMPRFRPPYPAVSGLWGKPTLVNNVETFCLVPWILRNGPEAFAALGTETSAGTKVFALAGKVVRGGLIEVPMGVTLRRIVEEIGGGIADGKALKAVQIGGPSGGCVPAHLAETPVDFEALGAVGAIMGSGGMVVLDDDDCMVDIARYFLQFTQDQSCGKCTFCRVGTRRMLDVLERLCDGRGKTSDLEELEELSRFIIKGSLCGLGKTAPNPVLSSLKYFRDEYEAHLAGHCPAAKCKAMIHYTISEDCIGCTRCAQRCPAEAIEMQPYERHEIDPDKCVRCGTCKQVCPVGAVSVK